MPRVIFTGGAAAVPVEAGQLGAPADPTPRNTSRALSSVQGKPNSWARCTAHAQCGLASARGRVGAGGSAG